MPTRSRKQLTDADRAAARRLRTLFQGWQEKRKSAGRPYSQHALAEEMGVTQGAVWQYLNERIVIGFLAAHNFARAFGCQISDIRPEWSDAEAVIDSAGGVREGSAPYGADSKQRMRIEQLVEDFQGLTRRQQDEVLEHVAEIKRRNRELLDELNPTTR